jgi:tRNA nucleotidyltransferase (CCA-adding enzyme)
LRGIRFAARYGFTFERETSGLFRDAAIGGFLNKISGKRLYKELKILCGEQEAAKAFMLLRRHRLLETVDPALGWDNLKLKHARLLARALATFDDAGPGRRLDEWKAWFAVFFVAIGRRKCDRLFKHLNMPGDLRKVCAWTATELGRALKKLEKLGSSRAYGVTRLLREVPPEALVHLYLAGERRDRVLIINYVSDWMHVRPALTGGQIVDLGVPTGPKVGRMLEAILKLKLSGKLRTRADEVNYVRGRVK